MFLLGFKPILVGDDFSTDFSLQKPWPVLINGDPRKLSKAPSVINEHTLSPMVEVVLVSGHSAFGVLMGLCPWGNQWGVGSDGI